MSSGPYSVRSSNPVSARYAEQVRSRPDGPRNVQNRQTCSRSGFLFLRGPPKPAKILCHPRVLEIVEAKRLLAAPTSGYGFRPTASVVSPGGALFVRSSFASRPACVSALCNNEATEGGSASLNQTLIPTVGFPI